MQRIETEIGSSRVPLQLAKLKHSTRLTSIAAAADAAAAAAAASVATASSHRARSQVDRSGIPSSLRISWKKWTLLGNKNLSKTEFHFHVFCFVFSFLLDKKKKNTKLL